MKISFVRRLGRSAALCALLAARGSFVGEARADEPPAPSPAMTPPKLSKYVDAIDPRPASDITAPRLTVELSLDIDVAGAVTNATVSRSSGDDAVDRAALDAGRALVFEPATRDGKPAAARIRFEFAFAAHEPPTAPEPPQAPATIANPAAVAGVVRDRDDGKPIANAEVVVTTDAGPAYRTRTNGAGAFRVEGIAPGAAHVVATADGHVPMRVDETLDAGTITEITMRLELTPDPEAFVATARVEAPPREVTKRSLDRTELSKVAGTRGDPLRAVELMPGVGRPSATNGDTLPILRGAAGFDSQVYAEGAPVPILYHLNGLTSFMHSRVIDRVDLYPSNFSVRYGRKVGGVIDVRVRDPRTDRFHAALDVSLLDSSLVVETPIGEKLAVMAAARRSNIDAVLNSAASTADLAITSAPVYWDYQGVMTYRPTDADRIRLLGYGSSDRLAILLKKPADVDPSIRGTFDNSNTFHRVQLGWRHRFKGGSEQNTELTYGRLDQAGEFGTLGKIHFGIDTLQGRSEWSAVVSPAVRLIGGLDVQGNYFAGGYTGIPPTTGEGDQPMVFANQRQVHVDAHTWFWQPGAYVEAQLHPIPSVLITPGVRADYTDLVKKGAIDPRLSARWDVTTETALKAGVGHFSQPPTEPHAVSPIGNPNLDLTTAIHASAGVEQKVVGESVTASVEGFAKWIDGIVVGTPDGREPYFVNDQRGRVFGGELLLRMKPTGRFFGFLSYTLMRSERRDEGQPWRLFDRDQPHTLNAAGVYRLGRGWEVGASFRFASGTPYTPVVASSYDASTDVYVPRLGTTMSERNPSFMRLDARVEKKWTFQLWSLAVYADVQNVLNSPNRDGFQYSYDYTKRQGVAGLPIFPSLGLRGEL